MRKSFFKLILLVFVGVLITSCTSTRLVNNWNEPNYTGPAFREVLVVGITEKQSLRRIFERQFVNQLRKHAVKAIPSSRLLPGNREFTREDILAAIKGTLIDGIITTRKTGVKEKTRYVSGHNYIRPALGYGYYNYYDYYHRSYIEVHDPGYHEQFKVVTLETNLYEINGGRLIWTGVTETFDPDTSAKEIDAFIKVIIKELKGKNLL